MKSTKHILLADDDDDDRVLFENALQFVSPASRLSTVQNGEELMMTLRSGKIEKPDMLFLDLNMPIKNGFECLEEIKKTQSISNLPVLIFSTSSQTSAIETAFHLGAAHYITKPSDFNQLKKLIAHLLELDFSTPATSQNFCLRLT